MIKIIGIICLLVLVVGCSSETTKEPIDTLKGVCLDYGDKMLELGTKIGHLEEFEMGCEGCVVFSVNGGTSLYNYTTVYSYNCSKVADDYWRYPSSYDTNFNHAYEKCNETYSYLFNETRELLNLTFGSYSGLNFSSSNLTWIDYQDYVFDMDNVSVEFRNMTCEQITCKCAKNTSTPCMAYCMECKRAS